MCLNKALFEKLLAPQTVNKFLGIYVVMRFIRELKNFAFES
jgi:hypothetical protein